ncbi:GntR family transcriptional regulator [Rhizobium straminoryzae]|uniref:GntR family transcriptional regulator n=1 Tax=Rhizobium straminoryzae TaxID=1387186 RepID=A0A549TF80_9HYPH|nr:GntR family transcriptional regulator [Rhizobium straminoryzae]TRL41182.1 GntR family transcriptional regulator [Rhizobium straminoryzae]
MTAREERPAADRAGEGLPRYAQIQKILEERLIEGVYPIGSLMPPELELAVEFNSSRTTIREALRYLRERGYVERRQGVGTRVISATSRSTFFQSFGSLEELFQVAVETYYVVMDVKTVVLDQETAELVGGLAGEDWILVNGVRWTEPGGKPICYIQSYIPKRFEHVVDQLPDHEGPFFSLLERHADGPIEEAVQEIRALPMPPEFSRQLGLKPGAWSLQLLRRYVTEGGVLIASFNWHPADQMAYVMHIHRTREAAAD